MFQSGSILDDEGDEGSGQDLDLNLPPARSNQPDSVPAKTVDGFPAHIFRHMTSAATPGPN